MNDENWPLAQDPIFAEIWAKVTPYTMTSPQRGYALWQAVNHVIDNDIPGALVECGVWRGGVSHAHGANPEGPQRNAKDHAV